MTTRAHAIEALLLVTAGGVRWSSAWWQEGEVLERYDATPHRDECPPGRHRFIVRGNGNVARCAICGLRKAFARLDDPPRCSAMVKKRRFPMATARQCKGLAWAPGRRLCWTHFRKQRSAPPG